MKKYFYISILLLPFISLVVLSWALPEKLVKVSASEEKEAIDYPVDFALDPAHNILYVLYNNPPFLKVLDLKRKEKIYERALSNIDVGFLVYHSANKKLYISGRRDNSLTIIDFSLFNNFTVDEFDRAQVTLLKNIGKLPTQMVADNKYNRLFLLDREEKKLIAYDNNNNQLKDVSVGEGPFGLVYDEENNKVLVTNTQSHSLSIVDGSDYSVINVSVGSYPFDVKVNPKNKKVYVSNHTDNTVSILNEAEGKILKTLRTGFRPKRVGINILANKIYVSNYINDTVSVIDGNSDEIIKTIDLDQGSFPEEPVIDQEANKIFIPQEGLHAVTVIDGANDEIVVKSMPVGLSPFRIIINKNLNEAYVLNAVSENITFIDLASYRVTGGWPDLVAERPTKGNVLSRPNSIVHVGDKFYILNNFGKFVTIIDGKSDRPIETFKVGENPQRMAAFRNKIYVSNSEDDTLTIYNITTKAIKTLQVGDKPRYMMWNPATDKIYLVNYNDGTISVIDAVKDEIIKTIPVGKAPYYVSVNAQTNKIYALLSLSENAVVVIDGGTDEIEKKIELGFNPRFLRINFYNNKVYVSGKDKNSLTVIDGQSNEIISTINLPSPVSEIAINSSTNQIYAFRPNEKVLSYFPESNPKEIVDVGLEQFLPIGDTETFLNFLNSKNNILYISSLSNKVLLVFDTQKGEVTEVVPMNGSTWSYNPQVNKIYVLNRRGDSVSVIDGQTYKLLGTITNATPFLTPKFVVKKNYYFIAAGAMVLGIAVFFILRRRRIIPNIGNNL